MPAAPAAVYDFIRAEQDLRHIGMYYRYIVLFTMQYLFFLCARLDARTIHGKCKTAAPGGLPAKDGCFSVCMEKAPCFVQDASLVDLEGFEPLTSRMRTERSPN